jgi:capsular polysaccharide transport system permease protein
MNSTEDQSQKGIFSWLRRHPLFIWTVFTPTLVAIIYFGLVASDVYISESSFVIRSSEQNAASSGLGSLISSAVSGFAAAPNDALAVSDFILSREALRELNEKFDLKGYFTESHIDFVQRLGFLGFYDSFEHLYEYYLKRVKLRIDHAGAIINLRVSAFNPEQAHEINEKLLNTAEEKVNQLNERARRDLIAYAEREVTEAEQRVVDAAMALSTFRDKMLVVDPEKQTTFHYDLIGKMQVELIGTLTQLAQIQSLAPQSPAPVSLELKAKTLREEIAREISLIAGGENSLSRITADYEQLAIEREFAQEGLAIALTSLQAARNEAQKQQIYLERISNPSLPDEAMEPKRIRSIAATLVFGLVLWGILAMLLAGLKEHQS